MTVLLILCTFVVFIVVDLVWSRRKGQIPTVAPEPQPELAPEPGWVGGFRLPGNLQYHPGHGWVYRERRNMARTGVDDLAAALLGPIEKIELPRPGQWVRQGQKIWSFYRNGEKTEMVSPVEGEVIEINEAVLKNPALLREEPYRDGWLMAVYSPDEEGTLRNLLPTGLVFNWFRDAIQRLYSLQPQMAGASAADGGQPVQDMLATLSGHSWERVTREFFLTQA